MRKILNLALAVAGAFLFALLGPSAARAQFTTVTATVQDPNGIPYAGAVMNAILVPSTGGGYTLGGQPYSGRVGPVTLDSTGKFTAQFGDVTLITPGSPQWQITIDSAAATIQLSLGTGPQSFTYTSTGTTISGSSPVSLSSALNALAPKLTNFAGAGTGTIAGTVTAFHIPYASAANTLSDIAGSAVTGATGAITLTAGADTTKPLAINSHSATQSVTLVDVNSQSSVSADTPLTVRGLGTGSFTPGSAIAELHIAGESHNTSGFGWVLTNHTADVAKGAANDSLLEADVADSGQGEICGGGMPGDSNNVYTCLTWGNTINGPESIIAQPGGLITTNVPFAVKGAPSQTADLFDALNSSNVVLSGLDSAGNLYFKGTSSGLAKLGVAAAAGTPCQILLPTASPSANQFLQSAAPSGGTCQTTWAAGGGGVSSFSGDGTIITNSASTGAVTATIAGTSGGIPYFNTATSWASSAALTSHVIVTGGGAGTAPTIGNGDFTIDSTAHTLLSGASGLVDFSAISTANGFKVPVKAGCTAGANGAICYDSTNNATHVYGAGGQDFIVTGTTGGSFLSPSIIPRVGNAARNNLSNSALSDNGTIVASSEPFKSTVYQTNANCAANGTAANPSVVSCSAAAAGMFSCATNASTGTCQINTTAVTANSEISITQDAADGGASQLNVTCNTGNVLSATAPILASKSAGTSFTINLGTVTTNPACFEYIIMN
jgi:hypothetical protein